VMALLFSIYFAAVTSLSSPEVQLVLGQDRQIALGRFKRGLEVSLQRASFLDSPTVTSIQAMSMYLVSNLLLFSFCKCWCESDP
jgi:hypothetical protein